MLTFQQYIVALEKHFEDRADHLKDSIANGVPTDEYRQMCGRYREAVSAKDEVRSIFNKLAKLEEEDDEL